MSEWDTRETLARLAAALPDAPRWLETRSMLLNGSAEVLGLSEDPLALIARDPESHLIAVVGQPSPEAFREALYRNEGRGVALAQLDNAACAADHLPGWRQEQAVLHLLPNAACLPLPPPDAVRLIAITEIADVEEMPASLRDELRSAASYSEIAAAFTNGKPVAFCYCASVTETLWDISIDTLGPYRRGGHAAAVVSFMVRRMLERGKRPVWGAEESNAPSMGLAAKLGFKPAERLIVFHGPGE